MILEGDEAVAPGEDEDFVEELEQVEVVVLAGGGSLDCGDGLFDALGDDLCRGGNEQNPDGNAADGDELGYVEEQDGVASGDHEPAEGGPHYD